MFLIESLLGSFFHVKKRAGGIYIKKKVKKVAIGRAYMRPLINYIGTMIYDKKNCTVLSCYTYKFTLY